MFLGGIRPGQRFGDFRFNPRKFRGHFIFSRLICFKHVDYPLNLFTVPALPVYLRHSFSVRRIPRHVDNGVKLSAVLGISGYPRQIHRQVLPQCHRLVQLLLADVKHLQNCRVSLVVRPRLVGIHIHVTAQPPILHYALRNIRGLLLYFGIFKRLINRPHLFTELPRSDRVRGFITDAPRAAKKTEERPDSALIKPLLGSAPQAVNKLLQPFAVATFIGVGQEVSEVFREGLQEFRGALG